MPDDWHRLAEVASQLGPLLAPPERDELLRATCAAARSAFGAAACSVALVDGAELVFVASDGAGATEIVGVRMPATRGVAGFAVSSGQTLAVDDVRTDGRFAVDVAESTGYVPTTLLCAPISRGDDPLGVLSVLDRTVTGAAALELAGRFASLIEPVLAFGAVFADLGSALLHALAAVDDEHPDVVDALLERRRNPRGTDPALLAGVLDALGELGDVERDAAVRIVAELAAYARARRTRR
jgi:GAF domain-containing protein